MNHDQRQTLLARINSLPSAQKPPASIDLDDLLGQCHFSSPEKPNRPHRIEAQQWLPQEREEVFEFFSNAYNLEAFTPSHMHFRVMATPPIDMYPGQIIDYRLKVRGIPLRWQSEITCWEPPCRFIDVQTRGPYRLWHHEHRLEAHPDGGTLAIDKVQFIAPGPAFLNRWLVIPELERIFEYRQCKLRERFAPALTAVIDGTWPQASICRDVDPGEYTSPQTRMSA